LYVAASDIALHHSGVAFKLLTHLGNVDIESKLIGEFNIDNLLAAIAVLLSQEIELSEISAAVKSVTPIIGRMESFSADDMPTSIVDYAHTPDALINALKACKEHCQGDVWVVFGCGGDRDKGKRSLMGQAAENNADHIVITNDNPRSEAPEAIVADILKGCKKPERASIILNRAKAVVSTIKQAKAQDIVLMAGKGHEDYVIVGNEKIAYNERAVVQQQYSNGAIS
jgi:UDP-N-acetylmuramoyl-L-alanyl-D-glutamate--2,6-diaminopimelate ligase